MRGDKNVEETFSCIMYTDKVSDTDFIDAITEMDCYVAP